MQNPRQRLLWLLLLTLILLLSACSGQPSSEEAAPTPEEVPSVSEQEAEEPIGEESNEEEEAEEVEEAEEEEETASGEEVQGFLTVSNQVGAKVFEFHLLLPESWKGVFEMQQANEEAVSFLYTGNTKEEVFTIEAMSEATWEEKQNEENAGVGITEDRGVIFTYRVSRENPYEGEESDTFQSMIDSVPSIIASFEARTAQ